MRSQLAAVFDDVAVDAIKIGMLGSAEIAELVADLVATCECPVILDPVMVASSGDHLLADDATAALIELAQHADVLTPNLPELAVLIDDQPATTMDAAIEQARILAASTGAVVVAKGGHLEGPQADNAVVTPAGEVTRIAVPRVDTRNTHGTGCSLSSAIATRLAWGHGPEDAVRWATRWLHESIRAADALQIGHGNGPVDHSHTARRLQEVARASTTWSSTSEPARARIAPVGPHTEALWEVSAPWMTDILALPFIRDLADGTLPAEDFRFYLGQDALYLVGYAAALTALGGAWAEDARGAIADEQLMQRTWLADEPPAQPSTVTQAYTDFLLASVHSQPAAVGQAAVLPCYWLYAEVGVRLAEANHPDHPYHDWLATYAGDDFTEATTAALHRVEATLAADPSLADEAARACRIASRYELDFFAQADRAWIATPDERASHDR